MNTIRTLETSHPDVCEQAHPILDVQLLYEDTETGLRARRALGQVQEQLEFKCHLKLWRFDLLREPGLRELVAHEMETADLLVISFHGPDSLRGSVGDELEKWINRRCSTPRALVLSQDLKTGSHAGTEELVERIRARAELRAIDIFHHFEPAPVSAVVARRREETWFADAPSAFETTSLLQGERSPRHWGINE